MLRVLLNRFHKSPPDALLKSLPQAEMQAVRNVDVLPVEIALGLLPPTEQIQMIHYTWLLPVFKQLPKSLHALTLTALPEPQKTKIRRELELSDTAGAKTLPPALQGYLLNLFYNKIKPKEVLPLAFLPQTPLWQLATLTKPQLVELFDFMGIHDLAESIRHIINKNFLTKLYNCLDARQKQCLRACLHKPGKVSSTRMELEKWDGSPGKLERMLQLRGLMRVGKALCGQHPDFVWHLAHRLDHGRGVILLKNFAPQATVGVTPHLVQQVVNMIDLLYGKEGNNRDK